MACGRLADNNKGEEPDRIGKGQISFFFLLVFRYARMRMFTAMTKNVEIAPMRTDEWIRGWPDTEKVRAQAMGL